MSERATFVFGVCFTDSVYNCSGGDTMNNSGGNLNNNDADDDRSSVFAGRELLCRFLSLRGSL
jgi:hypothetical protein